MSILGFPGPMAPLVAYECSVYRKTRVCSTTPNVTSITTRVLATPFLRPSTPFAAAAAAAAAASAAAWAQALPAALSLGGREEQLRARNCDTWASDAECWPTTPLETGPRARMSD